MSSCFPDSLSVENGVLISSTGLWSKCLEMRLSLARERERGLARAKDYEGYSARMTSLPKRGTKVSYLCNCKGEVF